MAQLRIAPWIRSSVRKMPHVIAIASGLCAFCTLPRGVQAQESVKAEVIHPQFETALETAATLSPQEAEALLQRKQQIRQRMITRANNQPPSPPGLPLQVGPSTEVRAYEDPAVKFHGVPGTLILGRNNKNTRANGVLGSTLAEPVAVNNAAHVFAAGNFNHAEFSANGGVTWTNVPLPAGPADAPIACCDHDAVIDDATRVTFHSVLYVNSALTNGVLRIFVRRNINPPTAACFYDIDPVRGQQRCPRLPPSWAHQALFVSVRQRWCLRPDVPL